MRDIYPHRLTELWYYDDDSQTMNLWTDKDLQLSPYQFNDIGSFIWEHCDGNTSNEDIAKFLYENIDDKDISLSDVLDDVNSFLLEIRENGLVDWEEQERLDVLLIVPPFPRVYSKKAINTPEFSAPPLGVAYLASSLRNSGFSVAILDMHITAMLPEDIIANYKKYQPKIVGISTTTPTFPNSVLISRLIKAWDENVHIVMGGVHVTTSPHESLSKSAADIIVIGEGENSIVDIANAIIRGDGDLSSIEGIGFKDSSGEIVYTKPRIPVNDLDVIPYPARDLLNMDSYYKKGAIVSSRGCPYQCNYCSCSALSGHTYRKHSVKYVLDEIEHLIDTYGISYIDFHDDTFNLIPSRVFEFCEEIQKRNLSITWGCFCRVTNFDYEMATAMKDAGCEVIQFGVEAGNQAVLDSIKKKITLAEVENAVVAAKKANITKISCGFIIGHSLDTEETVNQTINFGVKLARCGVNGLYLSVLTPYPGTDIYEQLGKNGVRLINSDWEQFIFSKVVIETDNLTSNKLRELYSKGVFEFIKATASPT